MTRDKLRDLIHRLWTDHENVKPQEVADALQMFEFGGLKLTDNTAPYLSSAFVLVKSSDDYNPEYGDDRVCKCGHDYYRHFDTYEDMYACGCKYCGCLEFKEEDKTDTIAPDVCFKCGGDMEFVGGPNVCRCEGDKDDE